MFTTKKSAPEGLSKDSQIPSISVMADVNEFWWEKFLNDFAEAKDNFSNFPLVSKFQAIASVMDKKNQKNLCLALAYKSSDLLYNLTDAFSDFQVVASQKKEQNRHLFRLKSFMDYTTLQNMKNRTNKIKKELEDTEDHVVQPAPTVSSREKSKQTYGLTYGDPGYTFQIIGLDEHVENIKKHLMGRDSRETSFKVCGIYGLCGTGKTALAQKVFTDPEVCETFDPRIWICCSHTMVEQVDRNKVMKMVFEELGYDYDELNGLGITELLAAMKILLNEKKYLFVVDDVWGTDEWFAYLGDNPKEGDYRKRFCDGLPRDSGGAVLLTCRNPDTAMKMVGENNMHNLEPLDEASCEKIMEAYKIDLDKMSLLKVLPHCHGLPLAAKELAVCGKARSISES